MLVRHVSTAITFRLLAALFCFTLSGHVGATPTQYSFSTGVELPFGFGPAGSILPSIFTGTSVSGTFMYDPTAPATSVGSNGSTIYGGATGPMSQLSGVVGGFGFSDPRGFAVVGNDVVISGFPTLVDNFQLLADSQLSGGIHNLSGFSVNGFSLFNVRMFWIETQAVPELITDFLNDQNLLSAPPAFHGRLALDFLQIGDTSGTVSGIFFDSLTVARVPEPQTYALLIAGLGLLTFEVRRRRTSARRA